MSPVARCGVLLRDPSPVHQSHVSGRGSLFPQVGHKTGIFAPSLPPLGTGSLFSHQGTPCIGLLGSDVDTSYLSEIQGIESLVLVPALVGMPTLSSTRPCGPHAYQPAPSQSLAGPSRFDWPLDGFQCRISIYLICSTLVYILVPTSVVTQTSTHTW